jgi:catecholate siderophore receptor
VNGAGTMVSIAAYNNATDRLNFVNQTDLNWYVDTGSIRHTILAGVEYGQQDTSNYRQTGYFTDVGPNVTSISVPLGAPTLTGTTVDFRQSATDANNSGLAEYVALYVQDQVQLTDTLQLVAGLRFDNFDVAFRNNRTLAEFESSDDLWSPRLGLIWRPMEPLTLYASYTRGYVPRAGDQLSSLTLSNQALDPEEFDNYEPLAADRRPVDQGRRAVRLGPHHRPLVHDRVLRLPRHRDHPHRRRGLRRV